MKSDCVNDNSAIKCSITFWLLLWDSICTLILYGTCNWYSPKKSHVNLSPVTAALEQQKPLSEEEDAPCYNPAPFIFLVSCSFIQTQKMQILPLPIPMFQVPHPFATEIIYHTMFSSPSLKLTVLQLLKCSWLLPPAVETGGTTLKFKFKCLLNKQNLYCLTLKITVL